MPDIRAAEEPGEPAPAGDLDFNVDGLQAVVLEVLGSFAVTALAVFLTVYWVQSSFGKMITVVFAGCAVLYFVWFPDSARATLEAIVTTLTPA